MLRIEFIWVQFLYATHTILFHFPKKHFMKGFDYFMARKRMVPRTIKTSEIFVLLIDTEKLEPYNETVIIPTVYKDEKKLKEAVEELVVTDTVRLVDICNVNIVEKLYGMEEEKFIELAEVLPDRKADDAEE